MNMMYELYQAERPKSLREQRDEDTQRGELAAAISVLRRKLAIRLHLAGLRRRELNPRSSQDQERAERLARPQRARQLEQVRNASPPSRPADSRPGGQRKEALMARRILIPKAGDR